MSQACDREGAFRAEITEYGLVERESGAVAVTIKAKLVDFWNGEDWEDWQQYDMEAFGDLYIIKKDNGGINKMQVDALVKHTGWDGSLDSIVHRTWEPTACQVYVKPNEYKGVTTYKVAFINALDRTPGSMQTIDDSKAKALSAKYGSQLRAVASSAKMNGSAPAGRPALPPRNEMGHTPDEVNKAMAEAAASKPGDDDIPFAVLLPFIVALLGCGLLA